MDPNETLRRARHAARRHEETGEREYLEAAVEAFNDLDAWLMTGGFLPGAWTSQGRSLADVRLAEELVANEVGDTEAGFTERR